MHSVTRESIRKQNKQTKKEKKKNLRYNIFNNLVLSNELIKVELPPWKIKKADVSSVSPSSNFCFDLSHRHSTTVSLETRNSHNIFKSYIFSNCYNLQSVHFKLPAWHNKNSLFSFFKQAKLQIIEYLSQIHWLHLLELGLYEAACFKILHETLNYVRFSFKYQMYFCLLYTSPSPRDA